MNIRKLFVTCTATFALLTCIAGTSNINCGPANSCTEITWGYKENAFDEYVVEPTYVTQTGIKYDPSGMQISSTLIDRLTDEVENCLAQEFPLGIIPKDIVKAANCYRDNFVVHFDRQSFNVKIASNWQLSCDKSEQVLPTLAGSAGCIAKGLTPSDICPCKWRAGIQCPNNLIVTPNFFLYKDVLIRYITSCSNPWIVPKLATCATPTTTPLSNGNDPANGL